MKTRWGSCTAQGNISLNCLLTLVPEAVMDYVIVHELCHRIEMNHSSRFWRLVETVLPDYKIQKQWLKEHGADLVKGLE
jgi:predicted metal-dependent hydrolase